MMDKMSYVRKAVDSYENKGINATVIVENKRTGVVDSHGTINLKVLAAY